MPNTITPRRSNRLNPATSVFKSLRKTTRPTSVKSEPKCSKKTLVPVLQKPTEIQKVDVPSRHNDVREATAMEAEMQKQLEEMRLQLEAAVLNATNEKEERIRLQEVLAHAQQSVAAGAVLTENDALVNSTFCSANTSNVNTTATSTSISTTAANTIMSTGLGRAQEAPCPMSNAKYMQLQPSGSPYGIAYTGATQFSSSSASYVPTFMPPLTGYHHYRQQSFLPPPMPTQTYTERGFSNPHTAEGTRNHYKLHDLPEFTGRPEDWPIFSTTFRESTNMFNYTSSDNLFRLQKCVKGAAREVVEAMLIHPNNVEQAMAALEFRFGRPDILVRSQLLKIKEISQISEDKLELLIPFATKVQNLATFLEASGMSMQLTNPSLLDELISKLPMSKKLEWAERSLLFQPYATIRNFEEWLTGVARLICLVTPITSQSQSKAGHKVNTRNVLHAVEPSTSTMNTSSQNCRLCKKMQHRVFECSDYKDLDVSARWKLVKRQRLCFCCLKYGHNVRSCKMRKACGIRDCEKKHHPSLHETASETKVSTSTAVTKYPAIEKNILSCNIGRDNKILFRVLPVRLYGDGVVVRTYALLDEGSSVTLMSIELAKELCLHGHITDLKLQWFGKETFTNDSLVVDLQISADADGADKFKMESVQTVSGLSLPTQTLSTADLDPECKAELFSVAEYKDASPQILIGLDNCHLGVPIRVIGSNEYGPVIAETKLGYVVYGKTATAAERSTKDLVLHCEQVNEDEDVNLTRMVNEFFDIESFGVKKPKEKLTSASDKRALEILVGTTKKIGDRFQTGLLWKQNTIELPASYEMAQRRLMSLENKLKRDPEFSKRYGSIISSYVDKGYAKRLTDAEAKTNSPRTWYLPHFGVKNPNKPGKIRLVFDAAAKVNGVSLNDLLLKGPDDLKPLMGILFNFRMRPVAVTGDIKEMFHQVSIQPEDQDSQRFLWREDENEPVDVFVMQSMTFGASCSPCSANFVKNLNAKRFSKIHPRAVRAITEHHYVDDYVDCFDSIAEAIEVTNDVISIHKSGGFELRHFISNSKELLNGICHPNNEQPSQIVDMNVEAVVEKVLGMFWDPGEDVFLFKLNFSRVSKDVMASKRCPTKREFLGIIMSVFDPYGMIANFVVHIKLLLQLVWRHGVEWDQPIPWEIFEKWCQWKAVLPSVMQLKVARCHHPCLSMANRIVLHTFVDASEEAFSAVVYMRIEHEQEVGVSFICGKTKCAPKKLMSIPRLELSAAILGVRLCDSVVESHNLKVAERIYWSDSKTILSWLRSNPRHHKQFVGFRIAEILDTTKIGQWHWVPTKLNPADEATRARYPPIFRTNNKWINGPPFLQLPMHLWPSQPDDIGSHVCREEMKPKFLLHATKVNTPVFQLSRFSSYLKLKRTAAWVIRFFKMYCRQPTEKGELSALELDEAQQVLCAIAQRDAFSEEINQLKCQQQVERKSSIYKLTPYMDDDRLLRVYGRIDAATTIPFTARRPIILPKDHHLTELIVAHYHRSLRHQNDDTVANEIRQTFWVPSLRSAIRKVRGRCTFCRFRSASPLPPLMGQLPEDRVTPFVRPFTYTGLDYFGPVYITIGRRKEKRWIALFTCLTVRAVHLEVAADLSTDACILCIRNFVNRRGIPVRIRSDNGTNFIGANNELVDANIFDSEAIKAELSARSIEWVFNCPSNPHAGGCWERLVRAVKRVLAHTLNELAPRIETLLSALIEAENIINSRPLTHLPVTTEEEEPLTPNHFLMGVTNSTQTPGQIDERALCLQKQWRISQQIKDRFWQRWMKEYLPELTKRSKWFVKVPNLQVGDLVLICDVDLPRSQWMRGRIVRVFVGPDDQIRSADVKTSTGILRRPAVKLAVLDLCEAEVGPGASRGAGC